MTEYLRQLPTARPPGRIPVHNSVRPTRPFGSCGFRGWLTEPADRHERYDCGWAPELGQHYRVPTE